MRRDITVAANPRESRGKNEARRLRAAGQIPAVLYGSHKEALTLAVKPRDLVHVLRTKSGHNTIFNLAVDGGETTPVMIVDTQHDPVRGTILHADLKRIDLSKRLRVAVPVVTHGDPKGVKTQGGHFEAVARQVEIECLPDDIPEHFDMDVTEMLIGQSLRASDMPLSGSMALMSHPDTVIAHVIAPRGKSVAAEEEEVVAAAPEPEVAKKGKKEEGEKK